ncbi:mdm2-binding protein isoform X6 [Oncorhynchus mykiss]|uniref:mdm2-binding protein isoform X6 n=1 Tax=Oncorhynchus mykiss TaxID=8022 RepID=UPI00187783B6|nr:mdm2-binding protein isoform X6 [Oncorhynchus mykiss]
MDRYVLVVSFNQEEDKCAKALEAAKQIYDQLGSIASCNSKRRVSLFPACSLSGGPASQRWYFAVQTCHGTSQFCSTEWEELGSCQKNDEQEESPSTIEACLSALDEQEEKTDQPDPQQTQLYEEAAEGLHLLSDKLPPPGKALLDVIFLGFAEEAPKLKDFLPVIGSLKHMQTWHTAKMTIVTEHQAGWQKPASNLSARVVHPSSIMTCIDERELWRGGVLIREKKFASEVRFEGFSLRAQDRETWYSLLPSDPGSHNNSDHKLHSETNSDHNLQSEVFHYFRSVLDLVQLVTVSDIPSFLRSSTEFHLELSSKSLRDKRLLDQFRSLSGKVGALFSLSCTVSSMALPPASQLSSQKWKDFMSKRPKTLPVPYVEVKGESGHYFLLVQGSEGGGCKARLIHSANQINGAAAMATVNGLLKENSVSSSGSTTTDWLRSLPCLHGDQLLQRERKLAEVQTLVLKECLRRREEAEKPASIPVNDLKILLSLAREQYLKMHDSTLPKASTLLKDSSLPRVEPCGAEEVNLTTKTTEFIKHSQHADWPERSVLHNYENLQRTRQKLRFGLLSGSSSDCLLGPKDVQGQRTTSALLDAKELLRHFTPDGLPTGELQPLLVQRLGGNTFQMSPDLTPRKVTQIPFSQAASSHYHGLEFCLDEQGHKALDRDQGFVRLQSRLIRYETQTTCSKEPCPVPFALSPAPSPAVLSEPGSVPDGEALLNSDLPRIKRRSWDTDATHPHKRLAKSESSDSLGTVCV